MCAMQVGIQRGATLVEIVIALTILGILASAAVLTYVKQLPQARLNGAARQVMSDLMLARRQAVSQTQRVAVYFPGEEADQMAKKHYKICFDTNKDGAVDNTDCESPGNGKLKDIQKNYYGVTMNSLQNPTFNPRGTIHGVTNTTITLTAAGVTKKKCIKVSKAGQIRVCEVPLGNDCDC